MRIVVAILCIFVMMLAGCRTQVPNNPSCKYVYERHIEDLAKPPQADRVDSVMMLFSATGQRNQVAASHSFALFCLIKEEKSIESVTISWLPRSGQINPLAISPEIGVNMSIPDTLIWARRVGAFVERFGPYYVKEELYRKAKTQEQILNAGYIRYKVVDSGLRPNQATNCIHAISDIACNGDQFDRFLVTGRSRGRDAVSVIKLYFDQLGFIDGRLRNDAELQKQFGLAGIRRID